MSTPLVASPPEARLLRKSTGIRRCEPEAKTYPCASPSSTAGSIPKLLRLMPSG